jgi:Retroviral aspartyl protease
LPGTAQAFTDDEMKDMLVDMHSPAFHHLMARANYDIDAHSYLEITQYLQNLGLIEESFNKGNAQNKQHSNGEPKAHKAHKNHKKHGKNHCRKHPNGEHTWADCFDNTKGKNYRGNKNATNNNNNGSNKKHVRKAEARVLDVDSDADMDQALTIINLIEEVSNTTVELEDSKPSADITAVPPLPPSTVKRSVTFALNEQISKNNTSNKKRRLLNKHHFCYVQMPLSRKLRKVDDTSVSDLMTEVTVLIKNLTGSPQVKLTRVLIDTGCSKTLIKKQHVPDGLSKAKKAMLITWSTNGGKFNTRYEVPLTIVLPEFSSSMEVQWSCAIDETPDSTYDMILGRDLQSALRMDILFSPGTLVWNEISMPMRTGKQREQRHLNEYLDQVIEDLSLPKIIRDEATKILDANYKKADLEEFVKNIPHLTDAQKSQVRTLIYQYEPLFQGKLGLWDTPPVSLELEEGAKPFHARAYPIPHIHKETVCKEVERLCREGVLAKDSNSEWAAPTFIIPKKEGTVHFVTDFRQLK